jgi:hypothetical protein
LDDYGNLCCEDIEDGINHEWRPVMICKDCGEEHALTEEEKTAVVKQIDDSSDMDFFRMSRFGKWE